MSSGRPSRRSAPGEKERAVRVKAGGTGAPSPRGNPFRIPPDVDVLQLRARERERANQERENARGLRVQDKSTFASRVRANQARSRHGGPLHDAGEEEEEGDDAEQGSKLQKGSGASSLGKDPAWTLALTRDRQVEKEGLSEFVSRKREMFLVQYGLSVKREEMRALEQQGAREERALEQAERFLEDDAAMFDEFLKQNDRSAVEAIRVAEMEMKARMEQVAEIKKLTAQIVSAKSEIARQEDLLQEYRLYKRFLEGLAPPEWHQRRRERKRAARAIAAPGEGAVETEGTSPCKPENSKGDGGSSNASQDNSDDSEGEFELPLSSPQELLDLFTELEEQNLSLIQNSQDMEQSLEEARQNIASTNQRLNKETETLNIQVQELRAAIAREEERASDLELRANVFSLGELRQEEQEQVLEALSAKVCAVYRACVGTSEGNLGTLQMLTSVENRLEELLVELEGMPPERVHSAERAKHKERRLRMREEKARQQKQHQEERLRRALERAQAEITHRTGRRLVFRSEPPARRTHKERGQESSEREQEEARYFFS
ncbi:cilia- and flagella-associated protein 100 isoform X2 [Petromyzon marinus]|uniref:Cilia- and flagella-associated protein 100 isoform X1 n=1 Tax=Petromyzon marinus TaxID=7757 RepID=A0AAJ7TT96_PETMA|nr:cilia- and flagella-associated protein 100 isoform X1 [Petromyzon marinus]